MRRYLLIFIIPILIMPLYCLGATDEYKGSIVKVEGPLSNRQLTVNGKPFFIKGVGCSISGEEQLDLYLKLVRQTGANSIRRWGIGQARSVLDKASQYGLMVNMGIWVTSGPGFSANVAYRKSQMESILKAIQQYKDHPALLLWNIGNENIENMDEKVDKIAFCKFLEELCQKVHQIDPNHPVVYTGVGGQPLKILKKHTPSLDIYGVNTYAGIKNFRREWKGSAIQIPYIFSEYGPDGHWEVKKDDYDKPVEPTDTEKAEAFSKRWTNYIDRFRGDCLGGYAFLLEEKNEETETWWGITFQGLTRASYWVLYELYTGETAKNRAPVIRNLHLSPKSVQRGKKLRVRINAEDPDRDPLTYTISASERDGAFWAQQPEKNKFEYQVPNAPGIYRVYAIVKDDHGNITTANKTFQVR